MSAVTLVLLLFVGIAVTLLVVTDEDRRAEVVRRRELDAHRRGR